MARKEQSPYRGTASSKKSYNPEKKCSDTHLETLELRRFFTLRYLESNSPGSTFPPVVFSFTPLTLHTAAPRIHILPLLFHSLTPIWWWWCSALGCSLFFSLFQSLRACCWGPRFPPQSYHFGVARATFHPGKTVRPTNLHLNFAKFRFFHGLSCFCQSGRNFLLVPL